MKNIGKKLIMSCHAIKDWIFCEPKPWKDILSETKKEIDFFENQYNEIKQYCAGDVKDDELERKVAAINAKLERQSLGLNCLFQLVAIIFSFVSGGIVFGDKEVLGKMYLWVYPDEIALSVLHIVNIIVILLLMIVVVLCQHEYRKTSRMIGGLTMAKNLLEARIIERQKQREKWSSMIAIDYKDATADQLCLCASCKRLILKKFNWGE